MSCASSAAMTSRAPALLEHARLLADDLERRPHAQSRQHLRQALRRVIVLRQDVVLGVEPERHVDAASAVLAERMARAGKQQHCQKQNSGHDLSSGGKGERNERKERIRGEPPRHTPMDRAAPDGGTAAPEGDAAAVLRLVPLRSAPAFNGRRTTKLEPMPIPSLAATMSPPCSSTRCLAIDRPRPRPHAPRVVEGSAWRKRSNTCGRNSARNALAVVLRRQSARRGRRRRRQHVDAAPRGVNLIALCTRFQRIC